MDTDIRDEKIDEFIAKKLEEGWSQTSVTRARKRLADFCAFIYESEKELCDKTTYHMENAEETVNLITRWSAYLEEQGLSQRTVNEYLSVARKYVQFCGLASSSRTLDLTGEKFGDLTVLEPCVGKRSNERSLIWKCQCSCGKVVEIPANNLRKGFYTSCGCKKAERLKETNQYIEGTSLKMIFSDTVRKDNTSGCKGVFRKQGRWAVRIQYKGKRYYLGAYDKLDEAIRVRKDAEEKVREDAEKLKIRA